MLRYFYTLAYYLAIPGILLRLLWKARRNPGYLKRWNERFAFIDSFPQDSQSIWVHAVSVGETIAALPLIKSLLKNYPQYKIIVTSTTATGSAQVIKNLKDQVHHFYFPYDLPHFIKRFLKKTRTALCIIMETELWPNLLHCCREQNIPLLLANGRLSERSKKHYALIPRFTKTMLQAFSMVSAQGSLDAERFLSLGANQDRLMISGNIKFDMEISNSLLDEGHALRKSWNTENRPTLIAASTHEGEEEIILEAFKIVQQTIPDMLLILVPRHPERFTKVGEFCQSQGYSVHYRSLNQKPESSVPIYLGDTMGELRLLYSTADVAFVGGSLVPVGGHNLIEPAFFGLPVLSGSHLQNCEEIAKSLQDAGVAQVVTDANTFAAAVKQLFLSPHERQKINTRAQAVIKNNQGAVNKHLTWIKSVLN